MKTVWLRVTHSQAAGDLPAFAAQVTGPAWIIHETYPAVTFEKWAPGDPLPDVTGGFAGRIFGERAEVRWTREAGRISLWLVEQFGEKVDGADAYDALERHYYGLGYWRDGKFWEPVLPERGVNYPLQDVRDDDRPRFAVVEYYRKLTEFQGVTPEDVEERLNQPGMAEWRLAGFDSGKDGD